MNKRKTIAYILLIILLAGFLRFFGLTDRGLFYADETRYYRYTAAAKEGIDNYFRQNTAKTIRGFLATLLPLTEGFAGKPGHQFLGLIGLYLFGSQQCSVLFVSALLGVATVFLVFLIGRFYSLRVGILSALILSACSAHVLFSRSFLAHSNQAFFLVLAVYLYLVGLRPVSALCLGYAFLTHPTGILYFFPFVCCEIVLWFKKKRSFANILLFSALFLVPFFVVEGISIFGKPEFGSLIASLNKSYLSQVFFVGSEAANLGLMTNKNLGPFHLAVMSWLTNGAVFTILLISGAVFWFGYTFKKRGLLNFIIGVVPIGLFFYWQFISIHERLFREILVLFPFFCIVIAVFISRLNKGFAIFLILLLTTESLWHSKDVIFKVKSDYPRMEKFLIANKIDNIITPSGYLATTNDVLMPDAKDLRFYIAENIAQVKAIASKDGVNYVIIYPMDWLADEGFRFKALPLLKIPEPHFAYFPSFYETAKTVNKTQYLKHRNNPDAISVSLYDFPPGAGPPSAEKKEGI